MLKELRQLRRDRITLAMIVGIPVMQLLLFGYAINLNLRHLDAGVADQANSAASRALPGSADAGAAPRRDQRRHRGAGRLRAPAVRWARSGAGAGRWQRHRGAECGDPAGAGAVGYAPDQQHAAAARRQHCQRPGQRDQLLQPAAALCGEYRPRLDRGDPDHDPGDVHGSGGGARTRARQHGAADRHAGIAQRTDGGQGAALCGHRPAADHAGAGAGHLAVPGADPRQPAGHLPGRGAAGAGQPGAGPVDLHARALAVPGDADDAVPVPAVDPAVRLHVPVRRHATAGAVAGRSAAADPLPATGARHHAARRLAVGAVARRTGAAGLHRGDDDAGDPALPQAPGLKHAIR
ncbi:hypothetical protein G6F57_012091 [Rhizopus arrhizus]|nr:hypothetical protein G6F57_012091 [Rhizopus arrhizus]